MRIWCITLGLTLGLACGAVAGTPEQAAAVRTAYESAVEAWQLKVQLAKTPAERQALVAEAPDAVGAAKRMWSVIGDELDREWSLDPAAWFLRVAVTLVERGEDGLPRAMMAAEIQKVREAVERRHLRSAKLAPMCMALVACGDQPSLVLLRKIERENPDKEVSGVAALGLAMLSKNLGDDPKAMRQRLTMLRKAIIDAADVEIEGVSVAQLAQDELYIIMNLSKGMVAPDLEGVGSDGQPMHLSDYAGNVLVLLFWNSAAGGEKAVIGMVDAMRADERFKGRNFEVVGVNNDSPATLKELQETYQIGWPNFSDPENRLAKEYRVGSRPLAYVLGPDRKIHYVGNLGTFVELTAAAVLSDG